MSPSDATQTQAQPAPPGFDKELFFSIANRRNEAFKDAKKGNFNWMPPPSDKGNDYLCELEDVKIGVFTDKRTNQQETWFRPVFKIVDDRVDEHGNSITGRSFSRMYSTTENQLGIVGSLIAAMYGDIDCPDELGPAILGLLNLKGHVFSVAVKPSRDPQYPPNLFVNQRLGVGESV